jgi:RNA polymerase sigma-B factor
LKELDDAIGLDDCVGEDDTELEQAEARLMRRELRQEREPRLQEVVRLRYYEGLSQREVGKCLGASQMHVSRLERQALDRLRSRAAGLADEPASMANVTLCI